MKFSISLRPRPLIPKMSSWKESIQQCATPLCHPHSVICCHHIKTLVSVKVGVCTMNTGITVRHHASVPVLVAWKPFLAHLNSSLQAFISCTCFSPLATVNLTRGFRVLPLNHSPSSNVMPLIFALTKGT